VHEPARPMVPSDGERCQSGRAARATSFHSFAPWDNGACIVRPAARRNDRGGKVICPCMAGGGILKNREEQTPVAKVSVYPLKVEG